MAEVGEVLAKCSILFGVQLVETLSAKGLFTVEEMAALAAALGGNGAGGEISFAAPTAAREWREAQIARIMHARQALFPPETSD